MMNATWKPVLLIWAWKRAVRYDSGSSETVSPSSRRISSERRARLVPSASSLGWPDSVIGVPSGPGTGALRIEPIWPPSAPCTNTVMPPMPAIGSSHGAPTPCSMLVAQVVDVVRRHQQVVGAERRHLGVIGPVDDGGDGRGRAVGAHEARDGQRRVEDHRIADVLVPVIGAALRIARRVEQERLGDHQVRRRGGAGRGDDRVDRGGGEPGVERRVVAADQRLRSPQADRVDRVVGVDRADDHVIDAGGGDPRIVADGRRCRRARGRWRRRRPARPRCRPG
jgi:hypothetical protein